MIVRFVVRIFTYITNLICPPWSRFNTNKPIIDINHDTRYHMEDYSDDEIDASNSDENSQIYTKNITTRYPFKKSQSCTIKIYHCGFCGGNILYPQHMYCDKVYCSTSCRNHQIKYDEKSNETRKHHSFSI